MLREECYDVVLCLCKLDLRASDGDASYVVFDRQILRRKFSVGQIIRACRLACISKCGAHTRQKLGGAEGLCDVIVCPHVEQRNLGRFFRACREHDDRCRIRYANLADEILAVTVGESEVEQDKIGHVGGIHHPCFRTAAGEDDLIVVCFEKRRNKGSDVFFVLHKENFVFIIGHARHFPPW